MKRNSHLLRDYWNRKSSTFSSNFQLHLNWLPHSAQRNGRKLEN